MTTPDADERYILLVNERQWLLKTLSIQLHYYPAGALLGIYPKKAKPYIYKTPAACIFITSPQLETAQISSIGHTHKNKLWYISTKDYYPLTKMSKVVIHPTVLRESCFVGKVATHMVPYHVLHTCKTPLRRQLWNEEQWFPGAEGRAGRLGVQPRKGGVRMLAAMLVLVGGAVPPCYEMLRLSGRIPYWRSGMRGALCVSSGNRLRISSKKKMLDLREMGRKQHRRKTFVKSRQCKIQSFPQILTFRGNHLSNHRISFFKS